MSTYKTTDYCGRCGESPESGAHNLGRCVYVPSARSVAREFLSQVFHAIAHGDAAHRRWLEEALSAQEPALAKIIQRARAVEGDS